MARPPRLSGFDYRGGNRYFLTFCVHARRPIFKDASVIDLVMEQIQHTAGEQDIENLAYCFMHDHVHLLVAGSTGTSDLKAFARLMKQRSGWRFGRCHEGRLWQPGYYDRVLRSDEATKDVVRYIVENPVRAGMVISPNDYAPWGSGTYSREEVLDLIQDATPWRV